jgi:hypothetical protein
MNVKELIEKLMPLPEDNPVVIRGYEGGVDDLKNVEEVKIKKNVNTSWYYGPHDLCVKRADGLPAIYLW